jgi:hypothetical protein
MKHQNPKTYPTSWPNVKLIEPITRTIRDNIDQERANQSAIGNVLRLFVVRVSWKRARAQISEHDVIRYFIKTANVMKKKFVCFVCGKNNPRVQHNAHFHAIIGVVNPTSSKISHEEMRGALTKASKGEVLNVGVKAYNPSQRPFTDEDYIVGKHDWMMFHNPVFTPRKSLKV